MTSLKTRPRYSPRSLASLPGSKLWYRAVVAYLHFIQPLARVRGRIRGVLSPPEVALPPAHPQTSRGPRPSLREAVTDAFVAFKYEVTSSPGDAPFLIVKLDGRRKLLVRVADGNDAARKLYERHGFRETATREAGARGIIEVEMARPAPVPE